MEKTFDCLEFVLLIVVVFHGPGYTNELKIHYEQQYMIRQRSSYLILQDDNMNLCVYLDNNNVKLIIIFKI